MSNVALAAAALAVPAVLSAPVGSTATIADFGTLQERDGRTGFAIAENFRIADFSELDPIEALVLTIGRPEKLTSAIEAAGIDPQEVVFETLGFADPAGVDAFLEASDPDAVPDGYWVAAWGEHNLINDAGRMTDEFVFIRVL